MKISIFKSLLIFFAFCSFLIAEETELRPYKLINADTLIIKKINEEFVSNLLGNVHFFYGDTEFFSDEADIFEKQKIVRLWGNVKVYEDTLSLFADKVNYYRKTEKLYLNGNVLVKETHADSTYRTFDADNVKYFRNEQKFYATNNVSTYDQREDLHGKCGELNYFMKEGFGYLMKKPLLYFSKEDSLSISAEKIEYYEDYKKIIAKFNVVTKSNNSSIYSDFLLYFSEDEKAIYQGKPKLVSEFADAFAEEFQIYFKDEMIEKIELFDSCRVEFKTAENSEKKSWVTAQEMTFEYFEGKLKKCDARINVDSFFDQEKSETKNMVKNRASGQLLIIEITADEKIKSLHLTNGIKGTYKFIKK